MSMVLLRQRNTGRLTALNVGAIAHVTARAADDGAPNSADETDNSRSVQAPSPVFLVVQLTGAPQVSRHVPVNFEGEEDRTITSPDEAVQNFHAVARRAATE